MNNKKKKIKVIPVTAKIVIIFTLFILGSNLSTNYLNISYNRAVLVKLMKRLLANNLKRTR